MKGYDWLMSQNYIEQFRAAQGSFFFNRVSLNYYRCWFRAWGPFGGLVIRTSTAEMWSRRQQEFFAADLDLEREQFPYVD